MHFPVIPQSLTEIGPKERNFQRGGRSQKDRSRIAELTRAEIRVYCLADGKFAAKGLWINRIRRDASSDSRTSFDTERRAVKMCRDERN